MIKQKLIVGNWKENPESLEIAEKLLEISNIPQSSIKILHAVPSIFVGSLKDKGYENIILQNISEFEGGSHTGEISVKQMLSSGIQTSIVGHSETRLSPNNVRGDENKQVNLKIKNLIENKCGFILCVGEYERSEPGLHGLKDSADFSATHSEFVKQQLEECLKDIPSSEIADNVIAYEPVWAIGKNAKRVATNDEIVEMMKFIKKSLTPTLSEGEGEAPKVLYGGSVDENNAKEILDLEGVDGLLVGRASSDTDKWEKLLQNISTPPSPPLERVGRVQQISDLNIQSGHKMLLRLDLNVPINEKGEIVNDFRIQESIPTIKMLQEKGAKVIILAHREKGDFKVVAEYLKTKIENFKGLTPALSKGEGEVQIEQQVQNLQSGEVLLLDNLRLNEGEKKNDEIFAKKFVDLGAEFYINEAFSASHREHASIVGIPKLLNEKMGKNICALGPKFVNEIEKLSLVLKPQHPMLLIVGGAKFDTKLGMLEKFLNIADNIFVGGALAHNFWKQKSNYNLGKSLLDEEVKLTDNVLNSSKIILPNDVMVESREVKMPNEITSDERIVDFGSESLKQILKLAEQAQTIVWNGPLGYYEGGYESGTKNLLLGLSEIQKQFPEKTIILGGGDTVTEIDKTNDQLVKEGKEKMHFTLVSTGGGAMIDFLSNGTLPGIDAVSDKKQHFLDNTNIVILKN